ncbi:MULTISPECIES: branched-chain amino acid ABC transporter permease [unclassified Paracoccus (in: a-proteobacteria)]|uniref:branched-chain amino acid ABC transporter permease n=1 Tax=unclassified Paracoccus (in: a-proteobacteria) TaxID=2688777 RepID=UPI0016040385|nr:MULTISPECIES: branched-chain amino acid ABC transporter permease [unclassified Paracoccus (in: a-proteobacteria)]MBB1493039.1 branched-chain amino acid ABC transporter permease [Paracoccus sp. MC1854]MBB1499577.1 branched-chain amino acid ABC transporter permease [Paracoccus sp. MC1862]QQO45776.1 branched-chain amino acid ABC transporter permease [Paracoccus sp. MC1862]
MKKGLIAFAALLVLLALLPFVASNMVVFATMVLAKGLAVLGILVLLRADQVSFGHAMFFAAGAYTAAFLTAAWRDIDLILLLVATLAVTGIAGLLIGIFVTRYRGIFFGMINLAFSMVLYSILEKAFHITGGSDGLRIRRPTLLGFEFSRSEFDLVMFYAALAIAAICCVLVGRYLLSPLGQALRAVKTNETRVEYLGLSAKSVLLTGYVISAMLCGLGGVLMGLVQGLASPEHAFWSRSAELVFIAVLGGQGHIAGAFAGTLVFEWVRTSAAALLDDSWQLILGVTLIAIILWAPGGLVQLWYRLAGRRATSDRVGSESEVGK